MGVSPMVQISLGLEEQLSWVNIGDFWSLPTNDTDDTAGSNAFHHLSGSSYEWRLFTSSMRLRTGSSNGELSVEDTSDSAYVVFSTGSPTIKLFSTWYQTFFDHLPTERLDCTTYEYCVAKGASCSTLLDSLPYLEFVIDGIRYVLSPGGYTFNKDHGGGCAIAVSEQDSTSSME